jgi:hypothetical protein
MTVSSLLVLLIVAGVIFWVLKVLPNIRSDRSARPGQARSDLSVEQLAATLRSGELPPPVRVSFPLQPGERCVGAVEAEVEQWLEGDGTYTHKYVGWAGGLAGLAVGSLSAAIGNSARKAAAAREAAARWRLVGAYRIYVTTERIAFEGGSTGREWQEVWLRDLRRVEVDGSTLELLSVGQPASRVHAAPAEYWALLLRRVAFDEVPGQLGA